MPQGPTGVNVAKLSGSTAFTNLSAGKQGDLLGSDLHGTKYAQAYGGNLFWGANQVAATLSNALATAYTGLCLSNPAASTKNLVVRQVTGLVQVAPAAVQTLGLISGFAAGGVTVHTTALTVGASQIGASAAASQAKIDAACTIVGTPTWNRQLFANAASAGLGGFTHEVNGGIILIPGAYLAIGSFGAAGPTTGFLGSFEWEEVIP